MIAFPDTDASRFQRQAQALLAPTQGRVRNTSRRNVAGDALQTTVWEQSRADLDGHASAIGSDQLALAQQGLAGEQRGHSLHTACHRFGGQHVGDAPSEELCATVAQHLAGALVDLDEPAAAAGQKDGVRRLLE
jgi:hypothetical protein